MGWEVGGKLKREGTYVYICIPKYTYVYHVDVWQKVTQYCKSDYPPIKNKF